MLKTAPKIWLFILLLLTNGCGKPSASPSLEAETKPINAKAGSRQNHPASKTGENMTKNLFLTEENTLSGRQAVFEDNGKSAWLYLTGRGSEKPAADAWVYNRIAAPRPEEVESFRPSPPPCHSVLRVKERCVRTRNNTNGLCSGRGTGNRSP